MISQELICSNVLNLLLNIIFFQNNLKLRKLILKFLVSK